MARVANRELCAVYWVQWHMTECPAPMDAQVFRLPRAGHSVPLSYNYYNDVIKAMCARSGLPPCEFSTHSLRRVGLHSLGCVARASRRSRKEVIGSQTVRQYLKASIIERLTMDMRVAVLLGAF